MPREFFIYTDDHEKCTVKEAGTETTHEFSDILSALNYVRQQRNGQQLKLTSYDPSGRVVFSEIV